MAKTPDNNSAKASTKSASKKTSAAKPRKTVAKTGTAKETAPMTNTATTTTPATPATSAGTNTSATGGSEHRAEAKTRFNAAVQEAKTKGRELANEGKAKLSGGIASLSRMVADNAHVVDEKLGAQYGDYARTASRSLDDTANRLDQKSLDELTEDGREFVRKSPGLAIGMAAVAGYMLSRIFGGSRR